MSNVREVLDVGDVTRVPKMPDFMRGVINLRGSVVPVVDMRKKLGMGVVENTVNSCIIVVEVAIDGEPVVIGAMVDSVQAVYELGDDDIEPPPTIGTNMDADHILGMGKHDDNFLIILDIDRVFSAKELYEVKEGDQVESVEMAL